MENTHPRNSPTVLCILDGWGLSETPDNNAIAQGETPNWDRLVAREPLGRLMASSTDVGLPEGQMGNSEVGHMNLGAGRVVLQGLPRIDQAFADGALDAHPALVGMAEKLLASGGTCHLLGLLSPGGVHSMQAHMVQLARILSQKGVTVAVHAFLDGRDTPPRSGHDFVRDFLDRIADLPAVSLATLCGRYYAMDRDKRWDRVAKAHAALVDGQGIHRGDALAAIAESYENDVSDEFVLPTVLGDYPGMADGDGLLMANFRADRARELLTSLTDPEFDGFHRDRLVEWSSRLGMVSYSTELDHRFDSLFPQEVPESVLGQWIAEAGRTQLRLAETEKYAHVTFFFNGGVETVFPGEDRILIPSPKVATYDQQPEMSADQVTDELVQAIREGRHDLIVVNFANGDMVGHTGNLAAAARAAEALDRCLGRIDAVVRETGAHWIITADHGNCEQMVDPDTGQPHTAHTLNPVPFLLVNGPAGITLRDGILADVAPTVLELMELAPPSQMTGRSLIDRVGVRAIS